MLYWFFPVLCWQEGDNAIKKIYLFFFNEESVYHMVTNIFVWHLAFVCEFFPKNIFIRQLAGRDLPQGLAFFPSHPSPVSFKHDVFAQVYILQSFCCMLSSWLYPLLVKITPSKLVKVVNVYLPRHLTAKKRWRGHLKEHPSAIILEFFGSQQYHGIHYVF